MKIKTITTYLCIFFSVYVSFFSCAKKPNGYKENKKVITETKSKENEIKDNYTPSTSEHEDSNDDWTNQLLADLSDVSYLTLEEKLVIVEVNKCRTNPKRYAEEYLKEYLNRFTSEKQYEYNGFTSTYAEGKVAVEEAIQEFLKATPTDALAPDEILYKTARYHNQDLGPKGMTGHEGTKGDSPSDRMKLFSPNSIGCGENLFFGQEDAKGCVIDLVIDDGIPGRGHRKNIMDKRYHYIGVAIGAHKKFGKMYTMNFSF